MGKPGRHPLPPADGFRGKLTTRTIPAGQTWIRLYRNHYDPVHFGTTGHSRFDAANGEFGMLYGAENIAGAFVETLIRGGVREITETQLQAYDVAEIRHRREMKLVDLTGKGLVRMGVDARLNTGDYRVAQAWSSAFMAHPDRAHGIVYPSRHDPDESLAAFHQRTKTQLICKTCGGLATYLGNEELFDLLNRYDIALIS